MRLKAIVSRGLAEDQFARVNSVFSSHTCVAFPFGKSFMMIMSHPLFKKGRQVQSDPDWKIWDADQVVLRAVVHRGIGMSFSLQASLEAKEAGASEVGALQCERYVSWGSLGRVSQLITRANDVLEKYVQARGIPKVYPPPQPFAVSGRTSIS